MNVAFGMDQFLNVFQWDPRPFYEASVDLPISHFNRLTPAYVCSPVSDLTPLLPSDPRTRS